MVGKEDHTGRRMLLDVHRGSVADADVDNDDDVDEIDEIEEEG